MCMYTHIKCICEYVYVYTYTCVNMCVYTHTYLADTFKDNKMNTHMYICVCIHIHKKHVQKLADVSMHRYDTYQSAKQMHAYLYIYVNMCMYRHIQKICIDIYGCTYA